MSNTPRRNSPPLTNIKTPSLRILGLVEDELHQLSRQGSIAYERRGRSSSVAKLRFRMNGVQRVKVLGSDEQFIARVRAELEALQIDRNQCQELKQMCQQAREVIRRHKAILAPLLEQQGMRFHGHSLRAKRKAV